MKKINLLFIGVMMLLITPEIYAQMTGVYTIDSASVTGGTNYQTFSAAITDLTTNGVSGPVTFNVLQGTYSEQISIPSITGSSVTNTITFKGMGDNTLLTAAPATTNLPVVSLNATSHITLDSLKIEVTGPQGWGVHFMNQTDSVTVQNCHIIVPALTPCYGVIASSSVTSTSATSNNAEYTSLINNHIEGGYYGILIKGVTTPLTTPSKKINYGTDITLSGNTIVDFSLRGIDLSYNHNVNILGNVVSSSVTTANYALRYWDAGDNAIISGNTFYLASNTNNTRVVALSMAPPNGPAGDILLPIIVSNNFIQYEGTNTTTPTGLLLKNKGYLKVYNNTIKVKNQGANANCIWFDASGSRGDIFGLEIRNNILSLDNSGSGHFFFNAANGTSFDNMVIDHNNYYAPSNYFSMKLPNGVNNIISTYTSLTAYQANTFGYGAGALNVDPQFVSTTDLHCTSVAMEDNGAVISAVTHDIDGDVRSLTTPDMGADEYSTALVICLGPTQTFVECDGFTITVGSHTYSTTGIYTDTLVGAGCDSVVVTDLTINLPSTFTQTLFECTGYSITVGGNTYSTTGIYMDTLSLAAANGCDSIVTTDLTINGISSFTQTFNECTGFSITVNGNTYSTTGVYTDTLVTGASTGCDSVIVTDLTVSSAIVNTQTFSECTGFSIVVNGNTYSTTGVYNDTVVNGSAAGCDSVIVTDLTIKLATASTDTQTACDSLVWMDGVTYTASNSTATDTLVNAAGCDSVITLNLTINNSTAATDTQVACDSYTWMDGITYTANNTTAIDTLVNAAGCDSVVTLDLTITISTSGIDVQSACDSYTWMDGVTYTASNSTATDTLVNAAGCDSVVTLNLTINNSTTSIDVQSACGSYTWMDGVTYTASNFTATDTLVNAAGCDSVVTLNLTINNSTTGVDTQIACDTYTWMDGNTYTTNNTTATHTISNAAGCDSVITLDLTISSVDVTTTTSGDTIIANATGFVYQWIDCSDNSEIDGETNSRFIASMNGSYAVVITDGNCSDTSVCVNLTNVGINEGEFNTSIRLYPNPTHGKVNLTFGDNTGRVQINVLDMSGKSLLEMYSEHKNVELDLSNFESGMYFVRVITPTGQRTIRLVKM